MYLTIGADILRDFEAASRREWLVTNGLGGYASGSLSGANTRRYHGLLVAALTPPTGRRTLLSRLEEAVTLDGVTYELAANQYPGAVYPQGFQYLERFDAYPAPTFLYRPRADVLLEKRVWMAQGQNTTYVQYTLRKAPGSVALRLTPLICWKDFHTEMHPWNGFPTLLEVADGETSLRATPDAPLLHMAAEEAMWESAGYWHNNIEHLRELERGLDFREDLYCPGHFHATLEPSASRTFMATIEPEPEAPEKSWKALLKRQKELIKQAGVEDDFGKALVLAADAFIIEGNRFTEQSAARSKSKIQNPKSKIRTTLLAGYPWFADWGRDTMIALPGLCLETGRPDVARNILRAFAEYVSEGMLPNRFPDTGEEPEYNTVDATLWYFEAIRRYGESRVESRESRVIPQSSQHSALSTQHVALARDLWPVLTDVIRRHVCGTRYGIGVDPADGLLRAGQPGVQLTWMDARVDGRVITPRAGKPVEINALWINALRVMEALAVQLDEPSCEYADRADLASMSFRRAFVRGDGLGLYDVLTEGGPDAAIRPNQIIAASLFYSPLTDDEKRAVVETVERELVTPFGLRTLARSDPAYHGRYEGTMAQRDAVYHQGTVWPWLLGAFVEAHYRVYGDAEKACEFLLPMQAHLLEGGVGSISEVLDGDTPQRPDGCIAQAWSVGEVLRAWRLAA